MRKFKKQCLSGLLLAFTAISPAFSIDYINAQKFAETNGISHQWFPIQKMLIMRKGLNSIKFRVGEPTAIVNEKEVKLNGIPRIQNNLVLVPADALKKVFVGSKAVPVVQITPVQKTKEKTLPVPITNQTPIQNPPPANVNNILTNPSQNIQVNNQTPPVKTEPTQGGDSILIALRHSVREDHTRVVLEFSTPVTYNGEFKAGVYRLVISGCKNLIPTNRSNPVGRDIAKLDINSGANREGLILTFTLNQKEKTPVIKYLLEPFRMIIEIPASLNQLDANASPTVPIIPPSIITDKTSEKPSLNDIKTPEVETPPEINIEVPIEPLKNQTFKGRTIVIDPGHGGIDTGFEVVGRPPEKTINLETSIILKKELENAGFRVVLLRTGDTTMNYTQRLAMSNKNGGDLHISIHTAGSNDALKHGIACFTYTDDGVFHDDKQGFNYDTVYSEWLKSTRFDLAEFLAKKINARLTKHLQTDSRGVMKSPLLPLKFIMNPAVLIEIGMLSDKVEGKNLLSEKYKQAIAKSITNGIIDFFNGIELE